MADKYCMSCGTRMPEENQFCPNCGQNQNSTMPPPSPKKKSKTPFIILGAVLGIAVIAAAVLLGINIGNKNKEPLNTGSAITFPTTQAETPADDIPSANNVTDIKITETTTAAATTTTTTTTTTAAPFEYLTPYTHLISISQEDGGTLQRDYTLYNSFSRCTEVNGFTAFNLCGFFEENPNSDNSFLVGVSIDSSLCKAGYTYSGSGTEAEGVLFEVTYTENGDSVTFYSYERPDTFSICEVEIISVEPNNRITFRLNVHFNMGYDDTDFIFVGEGTADYEGTVSSTTVPAVQDNPPAVVTTTTSQAPANSGSTGSQGKLVNLTTGTTSDLYNVQGVYTQADGWASFIIYANDTAGMEGYNMALQATIDGVCCDANTRYSSSLSYKPPSFYLHVGTENGLATLDDVTYSDRFGECYFTIGSFEPLLNATYAIEIYFIGDDGNSYCFYGETSTEYTQGNEPPERIYDEPCNLCHTTGECSVCHGSGWFSEVAQIRCTTCSGMTGVCIGCDGKGYY